MIDIGNMRYFSTSVTVQDKNRKFLEKPLVDINSTVSIPLFSYKESTDRPNWWMWFGLMKEICPWLADFYSRLFIVAPQKRRTIWGGNRGRLWFSGDAGGRVVAVDGLALIVW